MEIIKNKRLYCYAQTMSIESDDKFRSWKKNYKMRYVISDHKLSFLSLYDDMRKKGITDYDVWFNTNWYPILDGIDDKCLIEEMTECKGWTGIFNLIPNLTAGSYIDFVMKVGYDDKDCMDIPEGNDRMLTVSDPDFVSRFHFYVLNRYDGIILGWGDDKPYYTIDDGYVKWDVHDRTNATIFSRNEVLYDLFAECKYGEHGEEVPYKAKVKIEGFIKTDQS